MTGREFVGALQRQGYAVRRRCKGFVWLCRGEQTLMVEEDAIIPEAVLERLLAPLSRPPPSVPSRRPSRPSSFGTLGAYPRTTPKA